MARVVYTIELLSKHMGWIPVAGPFLNKARTLRIAQKLGIRNIRVVEHTFRTAEIVQEKPIWASE